MDLVARSEDIQFNTTNPPVANLSRAPKPQRKKTSIASRQKGTRVTLHREPQSAAEDVYEACKSSCRGVAYDLAHFDELPEQRMDQKLKFVLTRSGRLPYLSLTFAVGFLSFFILFQSISQSMRPQKIIYKLPKRI